MVEVFLNIFRILCTKVLTLDIIFTNILIYLHFVFKFSCQDWYLISESRITEAFFKELIFFRIFLTFKVHIKPKQKMVRNNHQIVSVSYTSALLYHRILQVKFKVENRHATSIMWSSQGMQTTVTLESHSFPGTSCTATEKLYLEKADIHLSLCCSSSLSVANLVHLYCTIISLLFEIVTDLEFKNLRLIITR